MGTRDVKISHKGDYSVLAMKKKNGEEWRNLESKSEEFNNGMFIFLLLKNVK